MKFQRTIDPGRVPFTMRNSAELGDLGRGELVKDLIKCSFYVWCQSLQYSCAHSSLRHDRMAVITGLPTEKQP